MKTKFYKTFLLFCLFILILSSCEKKEVYKPEEAHNEEKEIQTVDNESKDNEFEGNEPEEKDTVSKEDIDLSLKPNEAGEVMILMYHNIGDKEAEWTRTPDNFKKDLITLYEKGYRFVSLKDFVNNTMVVEAGKTPVVLTFDDGNENNFRIIKDEKGEYIIDPNCAVGILEALKKEYPDFGITATFFIYGENPFRQKEFVEYKLKYLVENGYDIGNHTYSHKSVKNADDENEIQMEIGKQVMFINSILPNYEVNTYALCYGERPKNKDLVKYLEKGTYDGITYNNIAILNVGWNPAPSPVSVDFNPLSLPRIRASETNVDNVGIYNWLEYFDKNPDKRYISDGVKDIITVPRKFEEKIDFNKLGQKELYVYDTDNE